MNYKEYGILDVDGKRKYFKSGFQDIIDNNHLILYENNLGDSKNRIELEIDLKKAYNDEPICMIYFTCFLIEDFTYTTLFPILIKENTDAPIFLTFKENYIMNLEYTVF